MEKNQASTNDGQLLKIRDRSEAWRDGEAASITFIVTEDCQLRCKYCYICGKNTFHEMSFETAKGAVDYVLSRRDLFPYGSVVWDFIGGEPLLKVDLLDQICDYIKTRSYELNHHWFDNYRFSFATNGLLYGNSAVQRFIEKNKAHLDITISIDGTKEKHDAQRVFPDGSGSYDRILPLIPLWLEQFPEASTKATIGPGDLGYIKDSVLHLWELGLKTINMNVVMEDVWKDGDEVVFERQLVELADEIIDRKLYVDKNCSLFDRHIGFYQDPETENQNWCGAGRMLAVNTEGGFHPCVRFAQYSLSNRKSRDTGSLATGVDTNLLRPFHALDRVTQSPEECLSCEYASGCAWCQGNNYDMAQTDTISSRATYICKLHKARVRANNYFWNKLDKIAPPTDENDIRVAKLRQRKGLRSLLVLLDSAAPSFCYYETSEKPRQILDDETLRQIAFYALTENLSLNLILGDAPLTDAQREILKWNDYIVFRSASAAFAADEKTTDVFDFEADVWADDYRPTEHLIVRIAKDNLSRLPEFLAERSLATERISLFIKDMGAMTDADLETYRDVLKRLTAWLPEREEAKPLQLSILTDRLQLEERNHCDAGVKHVAVGPDGNFYVCPGFYYAENNDDFRIASVAEVLETRELPIKDKRLYRHEYAPICENCDAFHCRRCVWTNKRTTLEVNTPSRQQCVCAHLERNASRELIEPLYLQDFVSIPEIDYLDPFDELMKKRYARPQGDERQDENC
ncbi:MAG: radical SAM peptide maturase, CXXX-repeat target family [Thermoguttaceae bacterium]|nr:radical SAM peptide maturase, CXXX-repeat target family [Thermoguttaceae bacterium]